MSKTNPILDVKKLIEEFPRLTIPAGVVFGLLSLATIIKTMIEGFSWAEEAWNRDIAICIVVGCALAMLVITYLIDKSLRPRPILEEFPIPCLCTEPTLRWGYDSPKAKEFRYRIVVEDGGGKILFERKVPPGMFHKAIDEVQGKVKIKIEAYLGEKLIRTSKYINAEFYSSAVQKIKLTGKLRIAVHEDPGEKIFCYYHEDWEGFDIEFGCLLANELARKLGLESVVPEFVYYTWPEIIGATKDYSVDMSIASISMSREREEEHNIAFSVPYAESYIGAVAYMSEFSGRLDKDITLDDLLGKSVAVHCATTASTLTDLIKKDSRYKDRITFHVAKDNEDLNGMLRRKEASIVLYDYQRAFSMLGEGMFVQRFTHDIEMETDKYGVAFPKVSVKLKKIVDKIIEDNRSLLSENLNNRLKTQAEKAKEYAASDV